MLIHQTLHGYSKGHRLLASSIEIPKDMARELLFLSDMSGSSIVAGFENYFTGYPIPNTNYYAFAKTWYAKEMPRPGCVWTQTLLITFTQLGKISDLSILKSFFERPQNNLIEIFNSPIDFSINKNTVNNDSINLMHFEFLAQTFFNNSNNTLLLESNNSKSFEDIIFKLWSSQFPRLRRIFSFSTGSIANRTIGNESLDIQVIPSSMRSNFQRLKGTFKIIEVEEYKNIKVESWVEYLALNSDNSKLKEFLWLYGADLGDDRKTFPSLIQIYSSFLNKDKIEISELIELLGLNFPSPPQGRKLKKRCFSLNNNDTSKLFPKFNEQEIIYEFLETKYFDSFDISDLNLTNRIIILLNKSGINKEQKISLLKKLLRNKRVEDKVWENLENYGIPLSNVINIVSKDSQLLNKVISKNTSCLYNEELWTLPLKEQKEIYSLIPSIYLDLNWKEILHSMLNAGSDINAQQFHQQYKEKIIPVIFDWYSLKEKPKTNTAWFKLLSENINEVIKSINRVELIKPLFFNLLLNNLQYDDVTLKKINIQVWKKTFTNKLNINFLSKKTSLSLNIFLFCAALKENFKSADLVASQVFSSIHLGGSKGEITNSDWKKIKTASQDYSLKSLRKVQVWIFDWSYEEVPSEWDRCETLRRILVNSFIKNDWRMQLLIDSIKEEDLFARVFYYLKNRKKGRKTFNKILKDIKNNTLKVSKEKEAIIKKISTLS